MLKQMRKMGEVEAEPNLIPVMNLFVAMIPFLLLAVAFFQLGVIPATLPTHTENSSSVEANTEAVTVSVVISEEGFRLTIMNQNLTEATLNEMARTIPKESGQYDLEAFVQHLQTIKRRYPRSDTILVLPAERVPFADVVRSIDAAREIVSGSTGNERRTPLFPNVVLSRTV